MSVLGGNPLLAAAGGDYQISRSVRLRSSASAYLSRTFVSGNRQIWTWNAWVKRGRLGNAQHGLMYVNDGVAGTPRGGFYFNTDDTFIFTLNTSGSAFDVNLTTTQVFRDPSAWYMVTVAVDTTQATALNRVKLYINGSQITALSTASYPALNANTPFNTTYTYIQGATSAASSNFDGYLTEVNFIDGQALTPSSFGETDGATGVWKPKKYLGTYGTNGFYLNFSDNSAATAAAIGKDSSGNGNNWTPNNISVTAGVTYDSMLDTPTPYADGGNGRGNYAVWNPLGGSGVTVTDGNLKAANAAASYLGCFGSIALPTTGKFYFEAQLTANSGGSNIANFGIAPTNTALSGNQVGATNSASFYCGGTISINGSNSVRGSAGLTTDVFQACYDAATGNVFLGINNTFYQSNGSSGGDPANGTNPSRTLTAGELAAWMFGYQIGWTINFGQRPFAYTPPTGFKALNTQNLPDSTIKKGNQYFDVKTYTGNGTAIGTTQNITGLSLQPDLVWIKDRSNGANNSWSHYLVDSVRGINANGSAYLCSNETSAEVAANSGYGITSLNSDGFSLKGNGTLTNTNGDAYVSWNWKKGATQGFDIVTYTGTGGGSVRTISHSLGVAPSMMITKCRGTAVFGTDSWVVYFKGFAINDYIFLNSAGAKGSSANYLPALPTSSVFSVGGTSANVSNESGLGYVNYLFAEVAGFSKFGSYTGNGSTDGPFVYCGFRPRFVLIKSTNAARNWRMFDTSRSNSNVVDDELYPNLSNAEGVFATMDILSNGFKFKTADDNTNGSGFTYIFCAFAENPFKNSLAR